MHDQPIIVKKKKVQAHGHHGGSWKVAYADFVTAMMAFFMVLWILGMSEDDRSVIASYFNDPIGFAKNEPRNKPSLVPPITGTPAWGKDRDSQTGQDPSKEDETNLRSVGKQLDDALKADPDVAKLVDKVEVTLTPKGLLIELIEKEHSTFFDSGQATLKPDGRKLIADIAPFIARTGRKLSISGHTDAMPYGVGRGGYNNWDLSTDRAATVRRALSASGVGYDQIASVAGHAEKQLKDTAHPFSSVNRRVTILLHFSDQESGKSLLPGDQAKRDIGPHIQRKNPRAGKLSF